MSQNKCPEESISDDNSKLISKEEIIKLFQSRSQRLEFTSGSGYSKIWNRFQVVLCDGVKQNVVKCKTCLHFANFLASEGTSNLFKHKCRGNSGVSSGISSLFDCSITKTEKVKISLADKITLTKKAAIWCAKDMRSYDTIEGKGLKGFCAELIRISAKYGNSIDIDYLLPCSNTIANNTAKLAETGKEEVSF